MNAFASDNLSQLSPQPGPGGSNAGPDQRQDHQRSSSHLDAHFRASLSSVTLTKQPRHLSKRKARTNLVNRVLAATAYMTKLQWWERCLHRGQKDSEAQIAISPSGASRRISGIIRLALEENVGRHVMAFSRPPRGPIASSAQPPQ